MKKYLSGFLVILAIYVVAYIPVTLLMGAYGGVGVKGVGLQQQWHFYSNRGNVVTRQRQVALEVMFAPLLAVDRGMVHHTRTVGITVD